MTIDEARDIPLLSIHSALGSLLYAVKLELADLGAWVRLDYNEHTYLGIVVEVPIHNRQKAVDRLTRGAIQEDYDYRFKTICWTPQDTGYRQIITASVDLCHYPNRTPRKAAA